jgi:hypothetical protein
MVYYQSGQIKYKYEREVIKMTIQELVDKLEACRRNLEGQEDNDTFWEINDIIYQLEKGRLEC